MSKAGYLGQIFARADTTVPTGTDQIDDLTDVTVSFPRDMLESTNFKSAGWKTRVAGLQDSSVDVSGHFNAGDAPQALLRSSKTSGATVYLTLLADPSATSGSQGWRVPMLVSEFTAKAAVNGLVEFTAKLSGNGAPTAV